MKYIEMVPIALTLESIVVIDGITFILIIICLVGYIMRFSKSFALLVSNIIYTSASTLLISLGSILLFILSFMALLYFVFGNYM